MHVGRFRPSAARTTEVAWQGPPGEWPATTQTLIAGRDRLAARFGPF